MFEILTIVFGVATVASLVLALYYQRQNKQLIRTRYRYSWSDVQQGVHGLIEAMRKKKIRPAIIVSFTGSGAVVANLFTKLYGQRLPAYHVMIEDPNEPWGYTPENHVRQEADRWIVHIPEAILGESRDKKVLILDSSFFSGNTIRTVKQYLVSNGFESVTLACLLRLDPPPAGPTAFQPDFAYYKNPTMEFYYPWGRG